MLQQFKRYQFDVTHKLEHGREDLAVQRVHLTLDLAMTQINLGVSTNHVDDEGMK